MEPGEALQEFLEYVLAGLVRKPEAAGVAHEISPEGKHIYRIKVDRADIGRVIGKNGYTISAIRSLAAAASERNGFSVRLKVYNDAGELVS
ncbi:KH domain-containing protein [soil metagenome]